jgi:hypothetical protein
MNRHLVKDRNVKQVMLTGGTSWRERVSEEGKGE